MNRISGMCRGGARIVEGSGFPVNRKGAAMTEYGLLASFIAILTIGALIPLGQRLQVAFMETELHLDMAVFGRDNMLGNGNFEDVEGLPETMWGYNAVTIEGWESENGLPFELHANGWDGMSSPEGGHWLDMGASPGNLSISQDPKNLIPGNAYSISLYAGDRDNGLSNHVDVYFGGKLVGQIDPSVPDTMELYEFTVVAGRTADENRIRLVETGPADSVGMSLDQIRIWGSGQ